MAEINEWDLSSGLPLDGASVEVTKVEFGFNSNIGAGILCANFTFTDLDSGEDIEQSFSVGDGWDASRDGSELISSTGRPRKISKNSNYGRLIASAIDALGSQERAAEVLGGSPRSASIWLGTRWRMGTVKVTTTNPTTGAQRERDAFIFAEFLGKGASGSAGAASSAPASAPAKAKAADNGVPDGIDGDLWEKLVALAREHDDHESFVEAALELDEVEGNKTAQKLVMSTKAGSVWAAR